jgi:putative methylase
MRLRKRNLEIILSKFSPHPRPAAELEQYELTPEAAAKIVTYAFDRGDIQGRRVCDLGCGTGRLALAAAICGAREVLCVDIDPVALNTLRENINIAERSSPVTVRTRVKLKQTDVAQVDVESTGVFDTVVQNPPFGVQRSSSDRVFLRKALELAPFVYSLHKRGDSVERFILAYVSQLGGEVEGKIPIDFHIPHQFDFHRKPRYTVEADLFMIRRKDYVAEED